MRGMGKQGSAHVLFGLEIKDWKGGVEMRSEEVWILILGG